MNWTQRVGTYSLLAGGVLAASADTADAQIFYSGPLNISIGQGNAFGLDLNSDSFNDLTLKNYVFVGGNYMGATVTFAPGQLVGFSASGLSYVSSLAPNALIGPGTVGPSFFGSMAYGSANPNAQFNNSNGGLLGLSFPAGGNTLYGWVRVNINQTSGTFTIVDYAYQTSPGTAINAGAIPEPSVTLGLLAAGAAGLGIYRRRRQA
ncbi:MAG: PEP-CTERM sorting domain-containing protein [Verrucomicrobia bacterium]|nr:PEP-CTERM sorting domain-containing protein [Verrucomicrobiota bacterium]